MELGVRVRRQVGEMPAGGAGFAGDEGGGGEIPQAEGFVESVEAAAGHPADVEGGGAEAADVGAVAQHGIEAANQWFKAILFVGESGGDERPAKLGFPACLDRLAIARRPAAAPRAEQLVGERVVDNAEFDSAPVRPGDGNRRLAVAVGEVHGAVDWVDDPHRLRQAVRRGQVG